MPEFSVTLDDNSVDLLFNALEEYYDLCDIDNQEGIVQLVTKLKKAIIKGEI